MAGVSGDWLTHMCRICRDSCVADVATHDSGAPGGIRTPDTRFRRPMLWSTELRARGPPHDTARHAVAPTGRATRPCEAQSAGAQQPALPPCASPVAAPGALPPDRRPPRRLRPGRAPGRGAAGRRADLEGRAPHAARSPGAPRQSPRRPARRAELCRRPGLTATRFVGACVPGRQPPSLSPPSGPPLVAVAMGARRAAQPARRRGQQDPDRPPPVDLLTGYRWPLSPGFASRCRSGRRPGAPASWTASASTTAWTSPPSAATGSWPPTTGTVLAAGRQFDACMGWVGDLGPYLRRLDAEAASGRRCRSWS